MTIAGELEGIVADALVGWAWDEAEPMRRVELFVWVDDRLVGRFLANKRHDGMAAAGSGDGHYGFAVPLARPLLDGRDHDVRLTLGDDGTIDGLAGRLRFPGIPPQGRDGSDADITLLAVIHGGAAAVDQWIAYHRAIGVGRFLLYLRGDGAASRLARSPRLGGIVEAVDWGAYAPWADAMERLQARAGWLAMLDTDEYLVPRQDRDIGTLLGRLGGATVLPIAVHSFGDQAPAAPGGRPAPDRLRYSRPLWAVRTIGRIDRLAGIDAGGARFMDTLAVDPHRLTPLPAGAAQINRYPVGPTPPDRKPDPFPRSLQRHFEDPVKTYDAAIDRHLAKMRQAMTTLFPAGDPGAEAGDPIRIFLHVGVHKTGTTSIQQFLARRRAALADAGILVPRTGVPSAFGNGHHELPWSLGEGKVPAETDALWAALRAEIAGSGCRRVILSAEDLSLLPPAGIDRVASYLAGFEIVPVVILRRPGDMLEGAYRTSIVSGSRHAIGEFVAGSDLGRGQADMVAAWRQAAAGGRMMIASYDDPAVAGDVAAAFMRWVEPGWTWDRDDSAFRHNAGLPAPVIEFARHLRDRAVPEGAVARWLEKMGQCSFDRTRIDQPRFMPPDVEVGLDWQYGRDLDRIEADPELTACIVSRLPRPSASDLPVLDGLEAAILALPDLLAGATPARETAAVGALLLPERLFHLPTVRRPGKVSGSLDLPAAAGPVAIGRDKPIRLAGWAIEGARVPQPARIAHFRALDRTAAADHVLPLDPGPARPDVAAAFPSAPQDLAMASGFTALLDPATLPAGSYEVRIGFADEDGICLAPGQVVLEIR